MANLSEQIKCWLISTYLNSQLCIRRCQHHPKKADTCYLIVKSIPVIPLCEQKREHLFRITIESFYKLILIQIKYYIVRRLLTYANILYFNFNTFQHLYTTQCTHISSYIEQDFELLCVQSSITDINVKRKTFFSNLNQMTLPRSIQQVLLIVLFFTVNITN